MAKVGIFVGTIYGNSLLVAEEARTILMEHFHKTTIYEYPEMLDLLKYKDGYALIITSTTGHGDLPDNILPLFKAIRETTSFQSGIHYGIIALGDKSYTNFCGGGKQFDKILQEKGACRVGEILFIDVRKHFEPKNISNPWVEYWATLLN